MLIFLRLLVFAAGAWLSQAHADGYWVVGPAFGLVVCVWTCSRPHDAADPKKLVFIAVSTLIYALVYYVARMDWDAGSGLLELLIGSMSVAVVVGSVLLPAAHRLILDKAPSAWRIAPFLLAASFYLVSFVASAADHFNFGGHIRFVSIAVVLWQAIYLAVFFPLKKSA